MNKGHGRIETRECWIISDPEGLATVGEPGTWQDLHTVIRVRAERRCGSEVAQETRHYLSNLPADTPHLARTAQEAVRRHCSIENELHWVLDIGFREDECRIRQGYAAECMAVLRHMALSLLIQETSRRPDIKNKRLLAG